MQEKKFAILKEILGDYRRSSEEYLFHCPFCKHHKPKFSVNLDKGAKCWVCGWATPKLFRVVRRLGTRQQKDEWQELEGSVDIGEFSLDLFENKKEEIQKTVISLPDEYISLANKALPRTAVFPLKYLKSRGLSHEDIFYWKMGYCTGGEYANRIIIPSFSIDGDINFFVARTFGKDWPKYKNPPAHRDIVFNELWIDWRKPVTIVEGVFDAIKAGPNSIPLLGSTLRENSVLFQEIVKNDPPVYLALDRDAQSKARHIAQRLMGHGIELYKIDLKGYNDVGEMTKEEFSELRRQTSPMESELELISQALSE